MHDLCFLSTDTRAIEAFLALGPRAQPARSGVKSQYASADSIAVIEARGFLSKYSDEFGPSSISLISQLRHAAVSPSVGKIVLWIDSGGGEVAGTEEVAATVAEVNRLKPVVSLVDGKAASAAYWIASQAGTVPPSRCVHCEIFVDKAQKNRVRPSGLGNRD